MKDVDNLKSIKEE
uniref:Uncharacterized protein tmp_locus_36 n=3 Tax=Simiiformes TaxID=314293 RepID=Q53S92_HUMAN|nr:unknown [Homo sapiens]